MPDTFEAEHMAAAEDVRHRDKRVSRGMAAILGVWAPFCWALAVVIGVSNATASKPVPAAALPAVIAAIVALGAMFALLAVSFAVLRTVVTRTDVIVKYGLWGPTIPLQKIESCRVVGYDWTRYGGWGIRLGVEGAWAYVPGPGDCVEIVYSDGDDVKKVLIGAGDPHKLALEIGRARDELVRARVDVDGDAGAEADAEAEALALEQAEAQAERVRRGTSS